MLGPRLTDVSVPSHDRDTAHFICPLDGGRVILGSQWGGNTAIGLDRARSVPLLVLRIELSGYCCILPSVEFGIGRTAMPGTGKSRKVIPLAIKPQRARAPKLTPLEFLLSIMRDPTVPVEQRIRVAVSSLPYCHPRLYDSRIPKKDALRTDAEQAVETGPWADEFGPSPRVTN
jgi:hypothetical protein